MKEAFEKHFLQLFGIVLVLIATIFDFTFFFIQYPERNHDTITMIAGAINSNMITGVIAFFYGSSKGSKDAAEQMNKMNGTKNPDSL